MTSHPRAWVVAANVCQPFGHLATVPVLGGERGEQLAVDDPAGDRPDDDRDGDGKCHDGHVEDRRL